MISKMKNKSYKICKMEILWLDKFNKMKTLIEIIFSKQINQLK